MGTMWIVEKDVKNIQVSGTRTRDFSLVKQKHIKRHLHWNFIRLKNLQDQDIALSFKSDLLLNIEGGFCSQGNM